MTEQNPVAEPTIEEQLAEAKANLREAVNELKDTIEKNQKPLLKYAAYAGGAALAIMFVRGQKQKKEAAKLAKTFFDLRVTKEQVALLQSSDLNVLYDTPFGQLLLAAVPPVQG